MKRYAKSGRESFASIFMARFGMRTHSTRHIGQTIASCTTPRRLAKVRLVLQPVPSTITLIEVVGVFETEQEAAREIERAKLEDAMYKHSKILFHAAICSVTNSFNVDRNTARYWIATAAEQM